MKCSVEDCNNLVLARGWCSKHYQRWLKTGSTDTVKLIKIDGNIQRKELDIDVIIKRYSQGDSVTQIGRDYNRGHKTITRTLLNAGVQIRKSQNGHGPARKTKAGTIGIKCLIEGCPSIARVRGLCAADYQLMSFKGRLDEFPIILVSDFIFGIFPDKFETSIYTLKREDIVIYVGSTKDPIKRLVQHRTKTYEKEVTLNIIRNVPDETAVVEECREIVYWFDLGFVLDNVRTPDKSNMRR